MNDIFALVATYNSLQKREREKDRKGKENGGRRKKGEGGGTFIANQTNGIKKDSIAKTIKNML